MPAEGIGDGAVNKSASQNIQFASNGNEDIRQPAEDYQAGKILVSCLI